MSEFPTRTRYEKVQRLVQESDWETARTVLVTNNLTSTNARQRAIAISDQGVISACEGNLSVARARFDEALTLDRDCVAARENLSLLDQFSGEEQVPPQFSQRKATDSGNRTRATRVAILSLLFNWPSTGGGTIHTAETGKFLSRAGYETRHIFAVFPEWGLGKVTEPTGVPSVPLEFLPEDWNAAEIQRRFRAALDAFEPDYVIITDSWNTKPLLAEAVAGYRYFLRLAALECLCPLNNVRLLVNDRHEVTSCPRNQLATPDICRQCVRDRQHTSGSLHQAERELAGFGQPDYAARLRKSFAEAEGVLAVNPLIATMVSPFTDKVYVVPSGFDLARFPAPPHRQDRRAKTRLFFAGLVDEYMKGFHVLLSACERLWEKRQDFELWATGEPPIASPPFLRSIGWLSQDELPHSLRDADCLVFPTIAEEALGRSAVEAMGAGIPVIASRIGGLPFTVTEGLTGLLFDPGNACDLAEKIELLLDDPDLRKRLGEAGRKKFDQDFTWEAIIERHYRRLLPPIQRLASPGEAAETISTGSVRDELLIEKTAATFALPIATARQMYDTFRSFERSAEWNGVHSDAALSGTDGFILCVLLSLTRPSRMVLVGSQSAAVARRLTALLAMVGLEAPVICYAEPTTHEGPLPAGIEVRYERPDDNVRTEILDLLGTGLIIAAGADTPLLDKLEFEIRSHFGLWSMAVIDPLRDVVDQPDDASTAEIDMDQVGPARMHRKNWFRASSSLALLLPDSLGFPRRSCVAVPVGATAPP